MPELHDDRRAADHAAARAARRHPRRGRVRAVRDHLLPPLVPAGAVRRPVPRAGQRQPRARRARSRRRAARSSTATATCSCDNRRASSCSSTRQLPAAERELAAEWGQRAAQRASGSKGRRGGRRSRSRRSRRALRARSAAGGVLGVSRARSSARRRSLGSCPTRRSRSRPTCPRRCATTCCERPEQFPGVDGRSRSTCATTRSGELAAQLLGTVGRDQPRASSSSQRFRGVEQGTIVGKGGLERTYDRYLRGRDGAQRIQVDALGRRQGPAARAREPIAGQPAAAVARPRPPAGRPAGAAAADPAAATRGGVRRDGPAQRRGPGDGLVSRASTRVCAKPITQTRYDAALRRGGRRAAVQPRDQRPLSDRLDVQADHGARRRSRRGIITPATTINDPGCIKVGDSERCNAAKQAYGAVALPQRAAGLLRRLLLQAGPRRSTRRAARSLQSWARTPRLRAARPGIDLPGEFEGIVPDRAWRASAMARKPRTRYEKRTGKPCCGFSDQRPWSVGDNVNLAVGQGDLQATPLQMAVAYARDRQRRPGRPAAPRRCRSRTPQGRLVQQIEPRPGAPGQDRPRPTGRRSAVGPAPGRQRPGRHVGRRLRRLAARPLPGLRQDRHRRAPPRATSPGTSPTCPSPTRADRRRGDRRAGRLRRRGRGAGRAPDPVAVVRRPGQARRAEAATR